MASDEVLERAKELAGSGKEADLKQAESLLRELVLGSEASDAEATKAKEAGIAQLADVYVKLQNAQALSDLLSQLRQFFSGIPKAKTAKIVRSIIDQIARIPGSTQLQVEVCRAQVEWARSEKRTFLRQRIELRLASLYLGTQDYPTALSILGTLLSEVKRLDDKLLLVDIHLLESRVHHAVRNLPKARAALTAARTAANAIYVPVALQADIDTQSGMLHAEERDYKTAYSYFFEAFEQYGSLAEVDFGAQAAQALKHMLMCKIMTGAAADVPSIISSKAGLKYTGRQVDAMRAVAKAYQDRSLQAFQDALDSYKEELVGDAMVHAHLAHLYSGLMQQNLLRLIEPYSRVEVAHIAGLIKLPVDVVEQKLSQMILDKALRGTLDQGAGCLEVFDDPPPPGVYPDALGVVDSLGRVVDTLFARSQKVMAV